MIYQSLSTYQNLLHIFCKNIRVKIISEYMKVSEFYHSWYLVKKWVTTSPSQTPPDLMFQNRGIYKIFHIFVISSHFLFLISYFPFFLLKYFISLISSSPLFCHNQKETEGRKTADYTDANQKFYFIIRNEIHLIS